VAKNAMLSIQMRSILGSNNWEIETFVKGVYDFYSESWIKKEETVEKYKL
jgi:hypothetical protein